MATKSKPAPRPALRRAADADRHPALVSVVPQARSGAAEGRTTTKATKRKNKSKKGQKANLLSAGRATSDTIIQGTKPKKPPKKVKLTLEIPKPLRKELRRRAKAAGVPVEEFTADLLAVWVGDDRWW
ncbi:MAG: hypothetical protein K0U64_02165 [Actinomycetia bacterium]|nr:hypothetical protein [Actinomycetes bacterium]